MAACAIETALAVRISAPVAAADRCSGMKTALIKRSRPLQAIRAELAINPAVADRGGRFL